MIRSGKPPEELKKNSSESMLPSEVGARRVLSVWIALVIAAIPFAYGKYIEFNTPGVFDSGLNVYHAQCVVQGQKIGQSTFPKAAPATLLVNVIGVGLFGFSDFGPKLLQTLFQVAALSMMFFSLRRLYGLLPAAAALLLASFFLSCPPYAKFGNVKEQFMIACMVLGVCGIIQCYLGGRWWWMVFSGAAVVNSYFFKQTGASVWVAIFIFILVQPILKQRHWGQFGTDVGGLILGALLGLLPLMIFYATQDRLGIFLSSLPVVKQVAALLQNKPAGVGSLVGEYVKGSRQVTDTASQFAVAMRYYRSFIVIMGLGIVAIGLGFVQGCKGLYARRKGVREESLGPEARWQYGFVLLFAIWWILDVVFIWVSPRNYVQYYLPMIGSGTMLGAFGLWRCQQRTRNFVGVMGVWLVLAFLFSQLIWVGDFPYLGLRLRPSATEEFWRPWLIQLIPLAVGVGLLVIRFPGRTFQRIGLLVVTCYAALVWVNPNIEEFNQYVDQLAQQRAQQVQPVWEKLARAIRENSTKEDGLYVWGWYPGIYVAAKRLSPATDPAYSDMHTDRPRRVERNIGKLLKDFSVDAPKFIVDSQKMHYPYNVHPIFQLWPTASGADKKVVYISPEWYRQNREQLMGQVQAFTFQMLRHPDRPGGPLDEDLARKLAKAERQRHEAMEPLREYLFKNYKPVVAANAPMKLFQLQKAPNGSP